MHMISDACTYNDAYIDCVNISTLCLLLMAGGIDKPTFVLPSATVNPTV